MKKIILLTMLLGLTGCGDNNQSGTQTNSQANTLQKAEPTPALANYSLVASPRTISAVAPLQGWNVTKSTVMGASTLIDAAKDTKISAALITPNAKQVAEVLRGGAAGFALSIAVEQLLGAVDWVMDPENNRIKYNDQSIPSDDPRREVDIIFNLYGKNIKVNTEGEACLLAFQAGGWAGYDLTVIPKGFGCYSIGHHIIAYGPGGEFGSIGLKIPKDKGLSIPLEAAAEQVISNADAGSLDAQVATNIAAQNILNDVVQAEPVVQELENNAKRKCTKHEIWMDDQAARVRDRYADLYRDRYNQYENHYEESNPLVLDGVNKGSWMGHVTQYRIQQVKLQGFITRAINDNCPPTTFATYWVRKDPPPKPGVDSPN